MFHIGQVSALYRINNTDSSGRDYRICSHWASFRLIHVPFWTRFTVLCWIQRLRLASFNGPNRVDASIPSPDDGNRSSFRNVVFLSIRNSGRCTSPEQSDTECIHHRQNPSDSTCTSFAYINGLSHPNEVKAEVRDQILFHTSIFFLHENNFYKVDKMLHKLYNGDRHKLYPSPHIIRMIQNDETDRACNTHGIAG
jgi:hypothetical protein